MPGKAFTPAAAEIEVVLRPAGQTDSAKVADTYLAARKGAVPGMPPPVHSDEEIRAHLASLPERKEVWVAETTGIGVIGLAVLADRWLDDLYVHPQSQRQGIGSALVDLAKERMRDGFCLWVFETNAAARAFYRRHGLVELERTDGSGNEEHAPDIRMAWPGVDPMAFWRREIDQVDAALAGLLDQRAAMTRQVQHLKRASGQSGRDPAREAEIIARMAARAPLLGQDRLARIVDAVITESLGAAQE